jgi:hypothetical protein
MLRLTNYGAAGVPISQMRLPWPGVIRTDQDRQIAGHLTGFDRHLVVGLVVVFDAEQMARRGS